MSPLLKALCGGLTCVISLHGNGAEPPGCTTPHEEQQYLAYQAQQAHNPQQAYEHLEALSRCQPQRGDLRIELVRLALQLNDYAAALRHRQWLAEHDLPPALAVLIDSWIASAVPTEQLAPAMAVHTTLLFLEQGYDSNSNDGSRHSIIPVSINGLSLNWEIDPGSQARPSHYTGMGLTHTYRQGTGRQWQLAAEALHFHDTHQSEYSAYGQLSLPTPCPGALNCSLEPSFSYRYHDQEQQAQVRLNYRMRTRQHMLTLWASRNHERNLGNSDGMGLQWSYAPGKQLSLFSGLESNRPIDHERAGGARVTAHAGVRLQPWSTLPLNLSGLWLHEWEDEPYATALWPGRYRNRTMTRLASDYSWTPSDQTRLKLSLSWRDTQSDIPLFEQTGWDIKLQLGVKL